MRRSLIQHDGEKTIVPAWLFWVAAAIVVPTLTAIVIGGFTITGALILGMSP